MTQDISRSQCASNEIHGGNFLLICYTNPFRLVGPTICYDFYYSVDHPCHFACKLVPHALDIFSTYLSEQ